MHRWVRCQKTASRHRRGMAGLGRLQTFARVEGVDGLDGPRMAARHGPGSFPVWAAVEVSRQKRTLHIRGKDRGERSREARPSPPALSGPHGQAVRIGTATDQSGNCSSLVSRPRNAATRLSTAKQVMIPVALESPPSCTTSNPATNGPKLVNTRPDPLQNATAVERTWVGNNSDM